jgi:hypothetical protein
MIGILTGASSIHRGVMLTRAIFVPYAATNFHHWARMVTRMPGKHISVSASRAMAVARGRRLEEEVQ